MSWIRITHITFAVLLSVLFWSGLAEAVQKDSSKKTKLARPTPEQLIWQDMEIGMFIHFGLETYLDKETDDELKMENLKLFNPSNVDTDQWVRIAESMGAKYIILVAKHVGGFCLWQTDTTDYSIKNTPYQDGQGDILTELTASCRRRGMKLGVYISAADLFHGAPISAGGKTSDPSQQANYLEVYRQQLIEVLSRYGTMMEVWFDGGVANEVDLSDILKKYAPKAMVFGGPNMTIRWVGNERGYASYPAWNSTTVPEAWGPLRADPNGRYWRPNECDTVIRDRWFWNSTNADTLKSVDKLMDIYYHSVGYSGVLLLNVAPDTSGRIPSADKKRAAEFGAEIQRRFGKGLAETKGSGAMIELDLKKPTPLDHVITMEDIRHGERVREYVIEGWIDDRWQDIAGGTAIGHKKIDRFEPVKASRIRLRIIEYAAPPMIRKLAVYNTTANVSLD